MTTARLTIAALLGAACAAAGAEERLGRLTLDVKIEGPGQTRAGPDHARYVTAQSVHMALTVLAGSEGDPFNLVDDGALKARMAHQNAAAQARMPSPEKQQEYARKMQAEAQACAGNVACMQRIAQAMAQQQAAWTQPQGAWAQPAAERAADEGRYANYGPAPACKGEFAARIADSVEGAFSDVGGMRPFTGRTTAAVKGDALQLATVCTGAVTVDNRTGKLYARLTLPRIDGQVVNTEAGRVVFETAKAEVSIHQEAWKWALAQLHGAARAGTQRTVLKVPISSSMGGKGEHQLNVEVRWHFNG